MDLFNLVARLTLDTSEYESSMQTAETKGSAFGEAMGGIAEGIKESLTIAGVVAIVNKISAAFAQAIQMSATYADTVDKGAQQLQISRRAYQQWNHALEQSGANINNVSIGVRNLNKAIEGVASDEVAGALDALNIDPTKYTQTESLLTDVMFALAAMGDTPERGTLVQALFGRNGQMLNALLNSGADGMHDLLSEAEEFGLIMSDEDIAKGVDYGDAVANMNAAVDALKQNIVTGLFPVLTDAANMISSIVAFFNGRTQERGVEQWFSDIDTAMQEAFATSVEGEGEVNSLIATLRSMSDDTGKAKGNLEQWEAVAQRLIELCPKLAEQVSIVNHSFSEQSGTLEENAAMWFQNVRMQAVSNAVQEKLNALTVKAGEIGEKQTQAILKQNEAMGKRAVAMEAFQKLIERSGLSDTEGYRTADLEALSNAELANRLAMFVAQNYTEDFLGMRRVTDSQAQEAQNAATALEATQTEYENLNSEIEELKGALQDATNEYNNYTAAASEYISSVQAGLDGLKDKTINIDFKVNWPTINFDSLFGGSHASGLNYVPYDGYIAELHRGETVLNQAQARQWRGEGSGTVGGINSQELASAVANAVRSAMAGVSINMNGERVGDVVTERVSSNLATQVRARRYGI